MDIVFYNIFQFGYVGKMELFQSNKKDQISLVTRQYLVERLMMKYQNRRSFCFGSTIKEIFDKWRSVYD